MRKIKSIVATALSLGMVLACSVTSFAAELPAQDHEVSVSVESSAARYDVLPDWVDKTCDVTGNGVALRRSPGTSSERLGLFYLDDEPWVVTSGEYQDKDGYTWMKVTNSSLGLSGWVAQNYLKIQK